MRRRRRRGFRIPVIVFPIIALAIVVMALMMLVHFRKIEADPLSIAPNEPVAILASKHRLAERLFSTQPELIRLTITPRYFSSTLKLDGELEQPIAQLCGPTCYLLGEHSYVYTGSSTKSLLPIISQLRIEPNSILKPAISRALAVTFELTTLSRIGLQRVDILTNEDLRFTTVAGWYFLLDPKQSPERQLRKLTFFLREKKGVLSKLKYIDLRLPQKIYFKD